MTRVLVVHHDIDIADQESDVLRRAGYDVIECIGPAGSPQPCPALRGLPCSFAEEADVLLYDVWAGGANDEGERLVEHLRTQYPDKPFVLTSPGFAPGWPEQEGRMAVTTIQGAPTRAALVEAIERALARARIGRTERPAEPSA